MSTPRFFTDPLSGATWPYKGRLTSAQMNYLLAGMRNLDYAIERSQAITYPSDGMITGSLCSAICLDAASDTVYLLENVTANDAGIYGLTVNGDEFVAGLVTAPAGGWTTSSKRFIRANPAGMLLVGAATVNASGQKIATSTDGATFTLRTLNTTGAGVGARCAVWDAVSSLWIVGLDGGSNTTRIETSPDGTTWTNRTTAAAIEPVAMATDGAGTIVSVGTGSVAHRSTNGTTWSSVTMPANSSWRAITYSPGLGLWFASDGSAYWATSPTGETWTDATSSFDKLHDLSDSPFFKLGCTGNIVIGYDGGSIWISEDGYTFSLVKDLVSSPTVYDIDATSSGVVACSYSGGSDTYAAIGLIHHI